MVSPTPTAELEIGLHRLDANRYAVELRSRPPDSDADMAPVRGTTTFDIQNVQGIWTARELEMADLRRGSRTRLKLDKLEYNVPMKDDDFTVQAIRRP